MFAQLPWVFQSLLKSLSEESDSGGIWNIIHHSESDKFLEGAPVINLKFKLFITEVEQVLQNQHLEQDQRINPLSPRIALPLLRVALLKQRAKSLLRYGFR